MDEFERYQVVINHEEQYSIWPEQREIPPGWTAVGVCGPRSECLDHIEKTWTDMRPLSLREWMAQNPDTGVDGPEMIEPPQRDLAEYLASHEHDVSLVIRGGDAEGRLSGIIARRFVQLRFPNTVGGTELTVELDQSRCELGALTDNGTSPDIKLIGRLELDYRPFECHATIALATLQGAGRLLPL